MHGKPIKTKKSCSPVLRQGKYFSFRIAVTCLFLCLTILSAKKPPEPIQETVSDQLLGTMVVLDLVDLSNGQTLPNLTNKLRLRLAPLKRWNVIPRNKLKEVLKKYDKDLNTPCNSTQCGFEFGSLIQADFLLFGTATRFRGIGILTLKLLNVRTAKVVWSKILSSKSANTAMEETFSTLKYELSLASLHDKNQEDNLLAIMDFSDGSLQAKLLFERILTHAYSDPFYDIMSPTEVYELTSVLDIKPESIMKSMFEMGEIGEKLGVNAVLFTQFTVTGINYKHSMALYDVEEKSIVLSMPPMPQGSFWDLLIMEKNFFSALAQMRNKEQQQKQK